MPLLALLLLLAACAPAAPPGRTGVYTPLPNVTGPAAGTSVACTPDPSGLAAACRPIP